MRQGAVDCARVTWSEIDDPSVGCSELELDHEPFTTGTARIFRERYRWCTVGGQPGQNSKSVLRHLVRSGNGGIVAHDCCAGAKSHAASASNLAAAPRPARAKATSLLITSSHSTS